MHDQLTMAWKRGWSLNTNTESLFAPKKQRERRAPIHVRHELLHWYFDGLAIGQPVGQTKIKLLYRSGDVFGNILESAEEP